MIERLRALTRQHPRESAAVALVVLGGLGIYNLVANSAIGGLLLIASAIMVAAGFIISARESGS